MHNLSISSQKKNPNLISTLIISPGATPTTNDRVASRFQKGSPKVTPSKAGRRATNVNMDPTSDFFRRHSLLLKSYNTKDVREWNENFTLLKLKPKFTVLIVDDAPCQIEPLLAMIESWDEIECEVAYDGLMAVQMVKDKLNEGYMYHLLFVDLMMPHDGFETTKDIRKEETLKKIRPKNCIIGVTAENLDPETDVKAKQSGMDDIFRKPWRKDMIFNILKKRAKELSIPLSITELD